MLEVSIGFEYLENVDFLMHKIALNAIEVLFFLLYLTLNERAHFSRIMTSRSTDF